MFEQIFIKRRPLTDIQRFDRVIDVLHNCKMDIAYMDKLKAPLSYDEKRYFQEEIDKINAAIDCLEYMKGKEKKKGWFSW